MRQKELTYTVTTTGCHEVTSHRVVKRPHIYRNGKCIAASRFVWENTNGLIPDGLLIRHKCDNPLCINVDHLQLGTQVDNMRDAIERKRFKYHAKLSDQDVEDIRTSSLGPTEIAKKYGICRTHASKLKNGKKRITRLGIDSSGRMLN